MRFEAKHQDMKRQAKVMHSRRHICLTFANKICFQNAYHILKNTDSMKIIRQFSINEENIINNFEKNLRSYQNCIKVNYNGCIYAVGDYIFSSSSKFAYKILQVGLDHKAEALKIITKQVALKYMKSLRSYKVSEFTNMIEYFDVSYFKSPPLNAHILDGHSYLRTEDF